MSPPRGIDLDMIASAFLPKSRYSCFFFFFLKKTVSDNLQFIFGKNIAKYRCIFDVFVVGFELSILLLHHLDVLLIMKIILSEHLEIHMLT